MNQVALMGRLTRDIELKTTPNGVSVATFTIAVDRRKGKDGEQQTDFINCVAWRGTADFASRYLRKGERVGLTGNIQTRNYTDKDGRKVYVTEVVAENVYFADGKANSGGNTQDYGANPNATPGQTQYNQNPNNFTEVGDDDDLPF